MKPLKDLIFEGNASASDSEGYNRGWFVGNFFEMTSLRQTCDLEVKWGQHTATERKPTPSLNEYATSLAILIDGEFRLEFPDLDHEVILSNPGDYVIYAPRVSHTWESLSDSVVVTVRWPSFPIDQKKSV